MKLQCPLLWHKRTNRSDGRHNSIAFSPATLAIRISWAIMSGSGPARKFFVAADDNPSSMDALNETVRLRHAEDDILVVNFYPHGTLPKEYGDVPSRRLTERFELFLTPRIGKSHWNVVQRELPEDTTVRRGIVDAVNEGGFDFLVAGAFRGAIPALICNNTV